MTWTEATSPVWGLVSGYDRTVRVVKPLAFMQAFSDDSASETGDRRLFLAGYLNWAQQWAEFADAWKAELDHPPSISYLRMFEAQNLREQFSGWSAPERDAKLQRLATVIERFRPVSFQFSLNRVEFDEHVKPHSPKPLTKPHFDCIFGIICMLANWSEQSGLQVPIDFIFDEQEGVSADVDLFFEEMTKPLTPVARSLINGKPIFRNDKQFFPLQAADMLAWHLRRNHETQEEWPLLPVLRKSGAHLIGELPISVMEQWGEEFKRIPHATAVRTRQQWRRIRQEMIQLAKLGFVPPSNGDPKESSFDYVKRCFAALMRFGRKTDE